MAIYNLAPCFDTGSTKVYIVDDGGNTLNIGEVWSANDGTIGSTVCGIVLEENTTGGTPTVTASTQYQNCIDCYQDNGINFEFRDCNSLQTYIVDPKQFTSVPQVGETFDIVYQAGLGQIDFQGCVVMERPNFFSQFGNTTILSGPFADCSTCQGSLPTTIYEIKKCLTNEIFYVELTGTTLNDGDMITFTGIGNPFEQFCGVNNGSVLGNTPDITLVSNLGDVKCNECLSQVSEKRIIENCLTGEQQVVWASALYDLGGSAYLSIKSEDQGCYKVGDLTTSAVTLETGYLDYGPSTSCEECIQCNGITIIYSSCTVNELTGASFTNQYVEIGEVILHPISGCCEVIGYDFTFSLPTTDGFYSYYTFSSCTECLNNESNYETWTVSPCAESGDEIVLTVPSGYTSGDTFEWNYGNTPWLCVSLFEPFVPNPFSNYQFAISNNNFTSCETCTNNLQFGISVINCGTGVQSFKNLTYTDLISIFYTVAYSGSFRATDGECYYLLEFCIYNDQYPLLIVEQVFNNCIDCQSFIPPPLSAGTEYTACVVCCPCEPGGTVRSVTVPHPTWTNQYGRSVVLLDAVQLGGMNGLNS
jgi:hypothetical protein